MAYTTHDRMEETLPPPPPMQRRGTRQFDDGAPLTQPQSKHIRPRIDNSLSSIDDKGQHEDDHRQATATTTEASPKNKPSTSSKKKHEALADVMCQQNGLYNDVLQYVLMSGGPGVGLEDGAENEKKDPLGPQNIATTLTKTAARLLEESREISYTTASLSSNAAAGGGDGDGPASGPASRSQSALGSRSVSRAEAMGAPAISAIAVSSFSERQREHFDEVVHFVTVATTQFAIDNVLEDVAFHRNKKVIVDALLYGLSLMCRFPVSRTAEDENGRPIREVLVQGIASLFVNLDMVAELQFLSSLRGKHVCDVIRWCIGTKKRILLDLSIGLVFRLVVLCFPRAPPDYTMSIAQCALHTDAVRRTYCGYEDCAGMIEELGTMRGIQSSFESYKDVLFLLDEARRFFVDKPHITSPGRRGSSAPNRSTEEEALKAETRQNPWMVAGTSKDLHYIAAVCFRALALWLDMNTDAQRSLFGAEVHERVHSVENDEVFEWRELVKHHELASRDIMYNERVASHCLRMHGAELDARNEIEESYAQRVQSINEDLRRLNWHARRQFQIVSAGPEPQPLAAAANSQNSSEMLDRGVPTAPQSHTTDSVKAPSITNPAASPPYTQHQLKSSTNEAEAPSLNQSRNASSELLPRDASTSGAAPITQKRQGTPPHQNAAPPSQPKTDIKQTRTPESSLNKSHSQTNSVATPSTTRVQQAQPLTSFTTTQKDSSQIREKSLNASKTSTSTSLEARYPLNDLHSAGVPVVGDSKHRDEKSQVPLNVSWNKGTGSSLAAPRFYFLEVLELDNINSVESEYRNETLRQERYAFAAVREIWNMDFQWVQELQAEERREALARQEFLVEQKRKAFSERHEEIARLHKKTASTGTQSVLSFNPADSSRAGTSLGGRASQALLERSVHSVIGNASVPASRSGTSTQHREGFPALTGAVSPTLPYTASSGVPKEYAQYAYGDPHSTAPSSLGFGAAAPHIIYPTSISGYGAPHQSGRSERDSSQHSASRKEIVVSTRVVSPTDDGPYQDGARHVGTYDVSERSSSSQVEHSTHAGSQRLAALEGMLQDLLDDQDIERSLVEDEEQAARKDLLRQLREGRMVEFDWSMGGYRRLISTYSTNASRMESRNETLAPAPPSAMPSGATYSMRVESVAQNTSSSRAGSGLPFIPQQEYLLQQHRQYAPGGGGVSHAHDQRHLPDFLRNSNASRATCSQCGRETTSSVRNHRGQGGGGAHHHNNDYQAQYVMSPHPLSSSLSDYEHNHHDAQGIQCPPLRGAPPSSSLVACVLRSPSRPVAKYGYGGAPQPMSEFLPRNSPDYKHGVALSYPMFQPPAHHNPTSSATGGVSGVTPTRSPLIPQRATTGGIDERFYVRRTY